MITKEQAQKLIILTAQIDVRSSNCTYEQMTGNKSGCVEDSKKLDAAWGEYQEFVNILVGDV